MDKQMQEFYMLLFFMEHDAQRIADKVRTVKDSISLHLIKNFRPRENVLHGIADLTGENRIDHMKEALENMKEMLYKVENIAKPEIK